MGLHDLFPRPKHLTELGDAIDFTGRSVAFDAPSEAPELVQRGIELVQRAESAAGSPYRVEVRIDPDDDSLAAQTGNVEAYALELGAQGGLLVGASATGVFLGCQTIRQLLGDQPADLSPLRIVDWPDLRYRGLYVESKWGPDLMTLADWRALVDYMAELKFNSLGIGVYGCWVVQYGGKRTEFLMLPFPDHPDLATPKTLRYFSPKADAWQTLEYLPKMVTDDLFGEVVAYAKSRNVTVRPHFNSPGHSTLIPRVFPEISALDEAGRPIGYGYCLSNPRTYEVLFELYDSVIERYLRPHGIEWFHIGMDEVEAYAGIDENDPARRVEPWCRCPECRDKPRDRQLQEYAVKVCLHLKEQGITQITMWNDALDKLDALDETFARMIEEAGLRENVAVQWWRYNDPVLVPKPELGLRAWSTPMAGYWSNLFTQSYTSNIYGMLLHGGRAGIEGADAYCIYDPAFDRNYACLAEFSWNQPGIEDLYQFKSRYARATLGKYLDNDLAVEAFDKYDQAFDSMPWTGNVLSSLLYYWHTYPAAGREQGTYPRDVFPDLLSSHMRLQRALGSAARHARTARDLFARANAEANDPLLEEYRVECEKLVGVWEAFLGVTRAIGRYEAASGTDAATDVKSAAGEVRAARDRFAGVMADLERVKASYLLPQILRDLSIVLVYFERLGDEFEAIARQLDAGEIAALPGFAELATNGEELDKYVSTAVEAVHA